MIDGHARRLDAALLDDGGALAHVKALGDDLVDFAGADVRRQAMTLGNGAGKIAVAVVEVAVSKGGSALGGRIVGAVAGDGATIAPGVSVDIATPSAREAARDPSLPHSVSGPAAAVPERAPTSKRNTKRQDIEQHALNNPLGEKGVIGAGDLVLPGLNHPVRGINPDYPASRLVIDAMHSPRIAAMVQCTSADCAEIAHKLLDAAGGRGDIIEVTPIAKGTLNTFENGKISSDQYYHHVYTDGRYVYDPRISLIPIPKDDWRIHMKAIHPKGIKISNNAKW